METQDDPAPEAIALSAGALRALLKTRFWVLFLGVVGVIVAIVGGIMLLVGAVTLGRDLPHGSFLIGEGAVLLIVFALFSIWQLRYSGGLRQLKAAPGMTNADIEELFARQRGLWRVTGILMLALIAVMILGAVLAASGGVPLQRLFSALSGG
ncbi:MAG TPA: hypothetical protein VFX38_03230 [Gammaproteobacteria bacterium]|nr:hypothetical protein [Gammaproteobacteria bacterium]